MLRPTRLVPASRRARVLGAALLWTAVGVGLACAGLFWTIGGTASPRVALATLALASGVGFAKGRFLLAPRARANVTRIAGSAEREGLLTVLHPAAWGLVAGMMALGWGLRHSGLPVVALGSIYVTVGAALLVGAAPTWGAWRRMRAPAVEEP